MEMKEREQKDKQKDNKTIINSVFFFSLSRKTLLFKKKKHSTQSYQEKIKRKGKRPA